MILQLRWRWSFVGLTLCFVGVSEGFESSMISFSVFFRFVTIDILAYIYARALKKKAESPMQENSAYSNIAH